MYNIWPSVSIGFLRNVNHNVRIVNISSKREIGERIRARREYLQLTQTDIASKMGTSRVNYGRYESGETNVTAEDLGRLASVLGVPVAYFYGDDDGGAVDEDVMLYYNGVPDDAKPIVRAAVKAIYDEYQRRNEAATIGKKAE